MRQVAVYLRYELCEKISAVPRHRYVKTSPIGLAKLNPLRSSIAIALPAE